MLLSQILPLSSVTVSLNPTLIICLLISQRNLRNYLLELIYKNEFRRNLLVLTNQEGATWWTINSFVDLGAEVKYIHSAFQGMRDLVRCLLPGETEDAEEGAALRGRESADAAGGHAAPGWTGRGSSWGRAARRAFWPGSHRDVSKLHVTPSAACTAQPEPPKGWLLLRDSGLCGAVCVCAPAYSLGGPRSDAARCWVGRKSEKQLWSQKTCVPRPRPKQRPGQVNYAPWTSVYQSENGQNRACEGCLGYQND